MLGNWSISEVVYKEILNLLPKGKTILELGSGEGTRELAKHYEIFSVEQNERYVGKNNKKENYIYGPLKNGWYNISKDDLPNHYDLLLIDGPIGKNRQNIIPNLSLFNLTDTIIIVDDVNRSGDMLVAKEISNKTGRKFKIISCTEKKSAVFQ